MMPAKLIFLSISKCSTTLNAGTVPIINSRLSSMKNGIKEN